MADLIDKDTEHGKNREILKIFLGRVQTTGGRSQATGGESLSQSLGQGLGHSRGDVTLISDHSKICAKL